MTLDPSTRRRTPSGERRIITVLFCDVAGSTSMAEQLDPEEWAEIMNDAFQYLIKPVNRYEGTVARLMGDGVLAFFGAPTAHEDDPQRAVMAALDIIEEIQPFRDEIRRDYGLEFNVRIGINTGPVVVGEVGTDMTAEYTAMGDAVNLAARMEQTAKPGMIQISEDTYRLVAPIFDCESLGSIQVKGKSDLVSSYSVLGRKDHPESLRGIRGVNAPLVGRRNEIEILKRIIVELREGRGKIVAVIGDAGLGKSRLIEELKEDWFKDFGSEDSWIESQAISYDTTRPYGLFQQHLRNVYQVNEHDSTDEVREKIVDKILGTAPDQRATRFDEIGVVYLLLTRAAEAFLLNEDRTDNPYAQAEDFKSEVYDAITNVWRDAASVQPMIMVFDDLHWADPASVDLLIHLFRVAEEAPILVLIAMRPERQSPGWKIKQIAEADYPHLYTELTINALSHRDTDKLVSSLLSIDDLPSRLHRIILEKTEGNPLFVEEVVRALLDRGVVTNEDGVMIWRESPGAEYIAIPDTLQSLLISRIDRLEERTRQILQMASVIGRSFFYNVLKSISDRAIELDRELSTLQRVELVYEAARIPEREYMFRHELIREAAYNSILLRSRRQFHRQVGEVMEALFHDRLEDQADRLAYHFSEASDFGRALKYFQIAGDAAVRLYANDEATSYYRRALELARRVSAPEDQLEVLIDKLNDALELSTQRDQTG